MDDLMSEFKGYPPSFSERIINRYCLSNEARWWIQVEESLEYDNPLKEMIVHLVSGDLWGTYDGVEIPSLAFDIELLNLDKRKDAIIDLLSDPGVNEKYIRQMADKLRIRCINENRQDLADAIFEAMQIQQSSEQRKISQEKRNWLKRRVVEYDETEWKW